MVTHDAEGIPAFGVVLRCPLAERRAKRAFEWVRYQLFL